MTKFSYKTIDEISEKFYDDVVLKNGFIAIPNKKVKCIVNGKTITINIQLNRALSSLWSRYESFIVGNCSNDKKVYDPIDADEKFHANHNQYYDDLGRLRTELIIAPGTKELTSEQVKRRVLLFIKIMQLVTNDSIIEYIANIAPKKKDGSLYLKRMIHIATCFCQREDMKMHEIYAQVKKEDEILISAHLETHVNVEELNKDLIVTTDLFKDI